MERNLVKLDLPSFLLLQKTRNWNDAETAKRLGISPEQLWKIKRGIHNPGVGFIAGLLSAFPTISFDDIFIIPNSLRARKQEDEIYGVR